MKVEFRELGLEGKGVFFASALSSYQKNEKSFCIYVETILCLIEHSTFVKSLVEAFMHEHLKGFS